MAKGISQKQSNGSALDFEAQLWAAAQAVHATHCKEPEYIGARPEGLSDPKSEWFIKDEPQRAEAAENRDEYLAANVFWLPPEARWHTIKAKAKSPEIGKVIDDAMGSIERENPTLKGVLPRDYARPSLDKVRLGGLVDIISNIGFNKSAAKSKDVLGRVYEYFLAPWERVPVPAFGGSVQGSPTRRGKFASAEGKGGGEFYTPQCVVQVLVAMLEPYKGRVFETLQSATTSCRSRRMNRRGIQTVRGQRWPCASTSGGMFVSSEKFVEEHGGRVGETLRSAQLNCSNRRKRWPCASTTTRKLARMNLAIRGIDANRGPRNADSFRADLHPDLKADFILANPSVGNK
jgi:type I restriction enzyme M protein